MTTRRRLRIEELRFPDIKGQPEETVRHTHRSFVRILRVVRSLETADSLVDSSRNAVIESRDLLARLKAEGF
jgi:hypothetical protein